MKGLFDFDNDSFVEEIVAPIMNAPKGTLAYEVRNDWAEVAMCINSDKLYNTPEIEED